MRRKKLFKSKRVGHIALEMQIHHQGIEGIKDLTNNKVIVLLHRVVLLGHIRHCLGHILVIMHPMTIIVCACNHTLFQIQIMVHYNNWLLAIVIRLIVMHVLVLNSVRVPTSKVLSIYSRGCVPRAYLTPEREDYKECTRKMQ